MRERRHCPRCRRPILARGGAYVWRTERDNAVRHDHQARDGQVFEWDDPPVDSHGFRGHPGQASGCRCWADNVPFSEDVDDDAAIDDAEIEISPNDEVDDRDVPPVLPPAAAVEPEFLDESEYQEEPAEPEEEQDDLKNLKELQDSLRDMGVVLSRRRRMEKRAAELAVRSDLEELEDELRAWSERRQCIAPPARPSRVESAPMNEPINYLGGPQLALWDI